MEKAAATVQHTRDAVYFRGFDGFLKSKRRQDVDEALFGTGGPIIRRPRMTRSGGML